MIKRGLFRIHVFPRESWSWEEFLARTPPCSIALDGMVRGGPRLDEATRHVNYDHHDGVVREATMSTVMQVFMAIKVKDSIIDLFGNETIHVYINDTDQDTSHAIWFLLNHGLFEGTRNIPHVGRHLYVNDKLDITGGAFPFHLDDKLTRQHVWVFEPYTNLRKSGALAMANEAVLENSLEACLSRLDQFLVNQGDESRPDTRHEILFRHPRFLMAHEIGGCEARYKLFSEGMTAFANVVAIRDDGRRVISIGRSSPHVRFPVLDYYADLNAAEGLPLNEGWGGSNIVGGSSRLHGTGLSNKDICDIILARLPS